MANKIERIQGKSIAPTIQRPRSHRRRGRRPRADLNPVPCDCEKAKTGFCKRILAFPGLDRGPRRAKKNGHGTVETSVVDESFEARANDRRDTMIARVARSPEEVRRFERERERSLQPHERAELIWQLTCELAVRRGTDAPQPRLDRSLARVERRGR